jgi:hypothetical protein
MRTITPRATGATVVPRATGATVVPRATGATVVPRATGGTNRRATRDGATKRTGENLPDGIGGTITGGPMKPICLVEILERGTRGASRGGAVSGAAQVAAGNYGESGRAGPGIALSDGSRISFTSIDDAGVFRDDNAPETPSRALVSI